MATVAELNTELKEQGFFMPIVDIHDMPYDDFHSDAEYHIRKQTGIMRTDSVESKKYTISLSGKDLDYVLRACEKYHSVLADLYKERFESELREVVESLATSAPAPSAE